MSEHTTDLVVQDDYDLAVELATALREPRLAGDVQWERTLAATLAQTAHTLASAADPDETVAPAITHLNGRPDADAVRTLLRR